MQTRVQINVIYWISSAGLQSLVNSSDSISVCDLAQGWHALDLEDLSLIWIWFDEEWAIWPLDDSSWTWVWIWIRWTTSDLVAWRFFVDLMIFVDLRDFGICREWFLLKWFLSFLSKSQIPPFSSCWRAIYSVKVSIL